MEINYTQFGAAPPELAQDPDYIRGREIIKFFHNASLTYPSYPFLSIDELMESYKVGHLIAEGLGLNARMNNITNEGAQEAMESLSDQGEGKLPASWQDYNNVLTKYAMNPSVAKGIVFALKETGKALEDPFAAVGEGVLSTLKSMKYLPYFLWGGAIFYVWANRKVVGKLIGGLTGKR